MKTTLDASVSRDHQPGLHVVVTNRGEVNEWFVLAYPLPGEDPMQVFSRAARALQERNAKILNHFVWHRKELQDEAKATWEAILGKTVWPVSWVVDPVGEAPYGGTSIRAVSGMEVEFLALRDRPIGATYETDFAEYLFLGDLRVDNPATSRAQQSEQVLADIMTCLNQAGMTFADVMRTWFFNEDILDWYDDFNRIRTAFFHEHKVFDRVVPASTGIGSPNGAGTAQIASLIAAKPKTEDFSFYPVPSPLQHSALEYGSSFSRAVEVSTPDRKHLFISGTASIDVEGKSIYVGSVKKQTEMTLDVVGEILKSRGMQWNNILQGVGYIRNSKDTDQVLEVFKRRKLQDIPILLSNNVICRDDLLFELELQAGAR